MKIKKVEERERTNKSSENRERLSQKGSPKTRSVRERDTYVGEEIGRIKREELTEQLERVTKREQGT